ncbi:hypothetical protein FHS85_005166 [Rhodoligotrophos appendicifer]|uniref:hypothetical protein n=1 Tax=Rhodoligotrophos appendicifer TaxID=987056 RepID=UPI0011869CD0|nr:hypothetical protein [Rhodoligotrophos appendicifer]
MSDKTKSDPELSTGSATGEAGIVFTAHAVGRVLNPMPSEHPMFNLVGAISSTWAHLEHVLDLVIWFLADTKPALGACVTAQLMGVAPRCQAIKALGKVRGLSEVTIKKVDHFLNSTHDASNKRNRIIHDPWYVDPTSDETAQFKSMSRNDWRYGIKSVTAEECRSALKIIESRFKDVLTLRRTIVDEVTEMERSKREA